MILCDDAMMFINSYFDGSLSLRVRDHILAHLVTCKECRKAYTQRAKEIGLKFDLCKEISSVYEEFDSDVECECRTEYNHYNKKGEIVARDNNWERAAKTYNYGKLANSKCINDFMKENYEVPKGQENNFRKFGEYTILQMAKNLDYLEKCYNLKENNK